MDQPMPSSPLPPSPMMSPQSPTPVAPKSHTWVIILVTVLVLGLGAAGAVWGYLRYSVPAETKILASFEKLTTVKTFAFSAKINASGEVQKRSDLLSGSFSTFNTSAATDTQESAPKEFTQASVEITMKGKAEEKAVDVSMNFLAKETDKTFPALGFDFISKGASFAFRIPSIPVIAGFDFSDFSNKWVTIDGKKLQEQLSAFIPPEVSDKLQTLEKENAAQDVVTSLKNTLVQQPPITVTKKYKAETVNGIKLQPYAFVLNQKNVEVIIDKLALYKKDTGVTEQDATDMKSFLKDIKKFDGMIWMDTQTLLPYKITIASQFIDTETQKPMDVNIVIDMKDFNKPMNISIPTDGFTLEQAIQKVTEKFMEKSLSELSSSSTSSTDMMFSSDFENFDSASLGGSETQSLSQDTDGDGVTDSLEEFYGTSITNKDTDGDGYTDKQEIDGGYDPLHPPKK